MAFIGRKQELVLLQRFMEQKIASLLVVRGRRRIGKSRLIEEFARNYKFYGFAGIAITAQTTAQSQRDEFASQLGKCGLPQVQSQDWNELFWLLADRVTKGKIVILLDEISWMGSCDPNFLGKLKNAWDQHFSKNPKLMLILCGSASSWIEKNILSSTGFIGRISHTLTLEALPLADCSEFWGNKVANNIAAQEKLKVLSVTGGVPRYLEEINPKLSAEENIKNLCFTQGALLVDEFEHIFANIFLRNSHMYKKLVELLVAGSKSFAEISKALYKESSGRLLEYLRELILVGFIKRDYTWHVKNGMDTKLSKFRLSDNYLRFYIKYISKYKTKIARNTFDFKSLNTLPGWHSIMGLQLEALVLNNRQYIWERLGITSTDIIAENPFFQNKTVRQSGCQIDYLIQTRFDTLYVCEIKMLKAPISYQIIDEVQQKINRLQRPKGVSCRSVLIHVNGVSEEVIEAEYFAAIINFSEVVS